MHLSVIIHVKQYVYVDRKAYVLCLKWDHLKHYLMPVLKLKFTFPIFQGHSYLYRYSTGTGPHGHSANLHQEITVLVPGATAFYLIPFRILKEAFQFHHKDVKVGICYEAGAIFKESETAEGIFGIVHHVHQLGRLP